MTNSNIKNNPYEIDHGYMPRHDLAMTGYGLTLSSIYHWLYENNLNIAPMGYLTDVFGPKPSADEINDPDAIEITEWINKTQPDSDFCWVEVSNLESGDFLMMFSVGPQADRVTIKSVDEADADLINIITKLFNVDDAHQASLKAFVEEYADDISVCDFS